ncbi:Hypothetical predicted protein, partial [Pelobates cultripes]
IKSREIGRKIGDHFTILLSSIEQNLDPNTISPIGMLYYPGRPLENIPLMTGHTTDHHRTGNNESHITNTINDMNTERQSMNTETQSIEIKEDTNIIQDRPPLYLEVENRLTLRKHHPQALEFFPQITERLTWRIIKDISP